MNITVATWDKVYSFTPDFLRISSAFPPWKILVPLSIVSAAIEVSGKSSPGIQIFTYSIFAVGIGKVLVNIGEIFQRAVYARTKVGMEEEVWGKSVFPPENFELTEMCLSYQKELSQIRPKALPFEIYQNLATRLMYIANIFAEEVTKELQKNKNLEKRWVEYGILILPKIYRKIYHSEPKKVKKEDWKQSFFTENSKQNKWRETHNEKISNILEKIGPLASSDYNSLWLKTHDSIDQSFPLLT